MMSDCSLSPKRKASHTVGSPNKRLNLCVNSDKENKTLGVIKAEVSISFDNPCEKPVTDAPLRIHPVRQLSGRHPVDTESGSSDSNDTATTIDNDGLFVLRDCGAKLPTPPGSEGSSAEMGDSVSSVTLRGVDGDPTDPDFSPLSGSAENDTEEFRHSISENEYAELQVSIRVTRFSAWAKVIDVSCTYAGVEVASASGHLIYRELIRDNFYNRMDSLGKPTSDRIDELLDHHGYFRWSIKEHYLTKDERGWNGSLDAGSVLQIDEVLVNKEWQSQALGALMVTSLIHRAEKRDCAANFAFVLPSTGCFWKIDEIGIKAFDNSHSWAEQNHVSLFLGVGFTRIAETGWFILDITGIDEDPGVDLQEGESKSSNQKILMAGLRK